MTHVQPDTSLPKIPNIKVYTAILNQTGATAPTATILKNNIGTLVWGYGSPGNYHVTLAGAFPPEKTICFFTNGKFAPNTIMGISGNTGNVINIIIADETNTQDDGLINNASLEIRVYE